MKSDQPEFKIVTWLSLNLPLLEHGLSLIQREYYLPDTIGSTGFVDLLCKDVYGNFVIVEVKRSNATARQAINEILKYHSLLKQKVRAKDSEIRVMIVSTHWDELIRPYSELVNRTTLSTIGFQVSQDALGQPVSVGQITPLPADVLERSFSRELRLDLFKSQSKRVASKSLLIDKLNSVGITDYIIVDLDGPVSNQVVNRFAMLCAFQRLSSNTLTSIIKSYSPEWELEVDKDDYDENALSDYLLVDLWNLLELYKSNDDAESCDPQKFDGILHQGWKISLLGKYGYFQEDPRLTDGMLINEMRGVNGNNRNKYNNVCESTHLPGVLEMQKESQNALLDNSSWAEHIFNVFKLLRNTKERYRITLKIYNPASAIYGLYQFLKKSDLRFLPGYLLIVEFIDKNETAYYTGELAWSGREPVKHLLNMDFNRFASIINGFENEADSLEFGLAYVNRLIDVRGEKIVKNENVVCDGNEIILDTSRYRSLTEFGSSNGKLLRVLSDYAKNSNI
jgi:hypothetical protein